MRVFRSSRVGVHCGKERVLLLRLKVCLLYPSAPHPAPKGKEATAHFPLAQTQKTHTNTRARSVVSAHDIFSFFVGLQRWSTPGSASSATPFVLLLHLRHPDVVCVCGGGAPLCVVSQAPVAPHDIRDERKGGEQRQKSG